MCNFQITIGFVLLASWPADCGRAGPPVAPRSIVHRKFGSDWPDFLGPLRNGKSTERGLPTHWPKDGPPILWQQPIGATYAAPTIRDGRLFHFARMGDVARLSCHNAETGDLLWKSEYTSDYSDLLGYNNGPRATPLVDGSHVFTFGAEGILQCVRVADGQMLWRIDTTKQFHVVKNFFGVASTPLVWNDLLLVNVGGSPPSGPENVYAASGRVKTNHCAIAAFDIATGKLRWTTGDDLASYASPVLARVNDRDIVFIFARAGLLAIDPNQGKALAQFPWRAKRLESVNASSPVVVGNEVFVSETYELGSALVRFTGQTFEEVWTDRARPRQRTLALHWNTPIVHCGYIYGSSGYHAPEAELRCVEWNTGKVMWSKPDLGRCSLLLVEDSLVCLSEDGTLRLIRATPKQYDELAQWELVGEGGAPLIKYPAWTVPALARGLLYVQGSDQLVCLELLNDP
ncbi:MAG: PQQ-like beta-propeller repeat protein [Pirellulales bacterium]|nr:PQQ-like beta-propeller repeat protein [Pirellulales bacterium]